MKTALIRINDETIHQLTRIMMTDLGFKICTENPTVIIIGWSKAQQNALKTICQMKGKAPILVCSAYTEPTKIRQALDAGADEYIMIPFDNDILQSKLIQMGVL